jgi:hypothetical protein
VDLDLRLREQCAALVERSGSDQPFGTYLVPSNDPAAEIGRAVERQVFGEFFGNTPEMLAEEYAPFEPSSIFLCVIDQRRLVPAGVSRSIVPSAAGFKSLHDIPRVWGADADDLIARSESGLELGRCRDIATLATARDYRGAGTEGLVSLALYQAIIMSSLATHAPWLVAVMDVAVIDLLSERIGSPFSKYPGVVPRRYLDSPASLPVYVDLPAYGNRLAGADANMHSILFEGTGLEAAVRTPDWAAEGAAAISALDLPLQTDSEMVERSAGRS